MRKERATLKVSSIVANEGQLPWLPANPRQWTKTDIDRTRNSIQEDPDFLEDRPLLVVPLDEKTWLVFAGNLRREGAKSGKVKEVPAVIYYPETEEDHLTIKRRALKDNGSFGSWDFDALANEWDDLPLTDWGVPGLDMGEEKQEEPEVVEDDFDEDEDVEPRVLPGDVYMLGDHRLMCGDSTKPEDVEKLMAGDIADMVFTDPPYGVSYVGTNNPNGKEWQMIANDDLRGDSLFQFLAHAFKNLADNLKSDGAFYVWFVSSNHIEFETALKMAGLRVKQELIWDKGMVLGHSDYHWTYEPCFYGTHKDKNCTWYGDRTQKTFLAMNRTEIRDLKKEELVDILLHLHEGRSCWRIAGDNAIEYIHPTQKPIALPGIGIKNSSCAGQIVLDLFGGSGSTMMACEQLGRKARIMEFDPKYCDKIITRWERYTGMKAEKL